jgi:hypothetical protein
MSKYIKLVEIVVVEIISSMENEWCFRTLNFMKTKLMNRLMTHLDLVICRFGQKFYTLENFPPLKNGKLFACAMHELFFGH